MRRRYLCATLALLLLRPSYSHAAESPCDQADTAVATFPVPQQSATAYRRARQVSDLAAKAQDADVVLLGDSLTQLWPDASARETFGGRVLNLGVGSDRTQNVLWRLQDERYARLSPRTVFLMIGTNNLGSGDKICAIRTGLEHIIERIDALWRKPFLVVVGILPRGRKSSFRDSERTSVNGELKEILLKRGHAVMVDDAEAALRCDEDQCPTFTPDMVHLAPPGYAALGASIRSKLDAVQKP
ncbi:GDSL-type esterase/lipase family protein [uncultured Methylobacterium sp.]|uniref:GDSL-type esterase/lipase family protein n=1 Tax=uncultured Methylobacterium sp. TaxID=157278 RepID=UPI0035CB9E95